VTELVTGWDLVEWQVRIAAGQPLTVGQDDIVLHGHAVEARVYAEDPAAGFLPTGGPVLAVVEPSGAGVRVDSGLAAGMTVGSDYDPMLAKVIVHAADRAGAVRGLDQALAQTAVLGVGTNVDFLRFVLADDDVKAGLLDTGLLERLVYIAPDVDDEAFIAAAVCRWLRRWPDTPADPWDIPAGWRVGEHTGWTVRLSCADRTDHVHITGTPQRGEVWIEGGKRRPFSAGLVGAGPVGERLCLTLDGIRCVFTVAEGDHRIWLAGELGTVMLAEVREAPARPDDEVRGDAELLSPMPGSVVAVGVDDGAAVTAGEVVVAVEAMKMEHSLRSPVDGVVELLVAVGDQVKVGQPLARIAAGENDRTEDGND
ncbi:MAG: acetyl/propionyl-CoA carboxylase subunit alpha, partial [Mycobacterium sp.]|nr:acetyl/propionyl-CoA carboxylase subunit alpha [Mycobacterium sp.]